MHAAPAALRQTAPYSGLCARPRARSHELPRITKKLKRTRNARTGGCGWQRESDGAQLAAAAARRAACGRGCGPCRCYDSEAELQSGSPGPSGLQLLPRIDHALTHFDWVLHPRLARWSGADPPLEGRWVAAEQLASYGLPAPLKKLIG